ncbi:hypothetical protein ABS648_13295 [Pseudomonas solani]|uniref:Lipoprotein n=1 Tax=Pseudomonas solani TaxID=2731552 RepID=A0AAU7YCE7_9PSED
MSDERQEGGSASAASAELGCLATQARPHNLAVSLKSLAPEHPLQGETSTQSECLFTAWQLGLKRKPAHQKFERMGHLPLPKKLEGSTHGFSYGKSGLVHYLNRLLIGLGFLVCAALLSACGERKTYIPPEARQCVEYTKKAIEARGEDYSRYTDKRFEDGEAVWVAGRRFDFGFVRKAPGEINPTFFSSDAWMENGKYLPGITAIYEDSVRRMKQVTPGVIFSDIDSAYPIIIIKMDCVMGSVPAVERYLPVENLANKLIGGASGYVVSLNESLGLYQALNRSEHGFDYFYMHKDGMVDLNFPSIFCDKDILTGICLAKITAWDNIVMRYRFPRRQLSDFSRIYQVTKRQIDAALAKGER